MTDLPRREAGAKALGLVIDLDICVGCHACAVSCKEWNDGGESGPLTDFDVSGEAPDGVWLNRVHGYEIENAAEGQTLYFPRSCLHCEIPACVTVCPTGASYKRAEDGIVLIDPDLCIGCKLCSWACPYGAREFDSKAGVMKKCTLCIDRIYNETLAEEDRVPACVAACPTGARHFGDLADPQSAIGDLVRTREGVDLLPELGYAPTNKYLPPRPRRAAATPGAPQRLAPVTLDEGAHPFWRWLDRLLTR